jgi:hypothetical protein
VAPTKFHSCLKKILTRSRFVLRWLLESLDDLDLERELLPLLELLLDLRLSRLSRFVLRRSRSLELRLRDEEWRLRRGRDLEH